MDHQPRPETGRDTTTRLEGEQATRLATEHAADLLRLMHDGLSILTPEGVHIDANPALCEMTGFSREELVGAGVPHPYWPPEEYPAIEQALLQATEGRSGTFELTFMRNGGERFPVLVTPSLVTDEKGAVVAVFATVKDLTELQRAQHELQESEQEHRVLFQTMPQGVVYQDADGRITSANPAAERILGLTLGQLQGRTPMDPGWRSIHEDGSDFPAADYPVNTALRTGHPVGEVVMGVFDPRSGTCTWVIVNAVPQFHPGEASPYRVFATFDDITETREAGEVKRLNAELKQAHTLLEETQEISRLGGWEYDVADRHLTWTEEVRRIFGVGPDYDPNDAIPDAGSSMTQSAPLFGQAFRRAVETGEPYDLEVELERADGAHIWVRSIGRPVLLNDAVVSVVGSIMDITERKQAEEALLRRSDELERQQELLATLLDTIPTPVFYKDASGVYLGCNQAFERLLGRERDEIVGKTAADLGPPEIAERYDAMDLRLLEQAGTQTYEWPVKAADGTLHDVVFNKATFSGSGGQVAGLIGVILDITERKRMEEALLESEERLRSLFATMAEGVVLFAADGEIISANLAAESILGLTRSQIQESAYDSPQWELRRPDGTPLPMEEMPGVRATREKRAVKDVVTGFTQADGAVSWINVSAAPLLDAAGRVEGVVTSFTDITERKRMEEALRQSEAELRTLIDTLPDLVWLKDPKGVYLSCNRRFESFFGAPEKDIVGKTDNDFMDADLADFFRQHDRAAAAAGIPTANEEEIVFAGDGHREILETIKTPIHASDGRLLGVLGVGRDITARKRAEEALRHSEERFRRVSAATSDFAYSCVKPPGGSFAFDWLTGAVERITGWSREELLAWGCWKRLVLEEDVPLFEERVIGLAPGESGVCELRIRDKQGAVRWLAAYSETEQDAEDPAVHRLYGACQDITARKRAEEALRESEA